MDRNQTENGSGPQGEAWSIIWLKKTWTWLKKTWTSFDTQRVQAVATVVMAGVAVWTLVFTPLGERLVSEINRTLRETEAELEHHRTLAGKVTLRALWKVADDRLAENEYFARIGADYQAHTTWIVKSEERAKKQKELEAKVAAGQEDAKTLEKREKRPWPTPSEWWLKMPYREGREFGIVPIHEKSRWGERAVEILDLWMKLREPQGDGYLVYQEFRRKLELLLDTHGRNGSEGAPRTGRALIEELKKDDAVAQLGTTGSETLRQTLDRFLRTHPDLASDTIRVQFEGPYSESQLIKTGEKVAKNVTRFRDEFRSFIKTECGPYF